MPRKPSRSRTLKTSPSQSVKLRVKTTLDTPEAIATTYRKESGRAFSDEQSIQLIRDVLQRQPSDNVVVIRGQGGTKAYPESWWSSRAMFVGEVEDLEDDELEDILYGLQPHGPRALDFYIRER